MDYFKDFCSRKCSNSNELTKMRVREYNMRVYGVPVTSQAQCVKDKAKQHFQETLGVDNPWQSKKVQQLSKHTKKTKYGDENYNNREKSELTCLDRYGVRVSSQNDDVKRKALITYHQVVFEKFGTEWPIQNADVKEKFKRTNMKNHNSTSYLNSDDYKKWSLETYGVENPMQCGEIRKKTTQKYSYNDISFDSAPEIAFYIYLKDNNMQFEYQPDVSFDYLFNGKVHRYFPDFKVGDKLYEIKGDHFFKDGKMVCPYRDKSWSDEQYLFECSKYEAKHQCMLENNVVILTSKDYRKYTDYVENAYGKDFLKQFKNQSANS